MQNLAAAAAILLIAGGAARAETASKLFECSIGERQVTVSKLKSHFVYRFGTATRNALVIDGEPSSGNVFRLRQMYAGPETQVRFTRGDLSYVVFAAEGNPQTGARSIAGVTVMRGVKTVSSLTCAHFTLFKDFDAAFAGVPEDSVAYSGL